VRLRRRIRVRRGAEVTAPSRAEPRRHHHQAGRVRARRHRPLDRRWPSGPTGSRPMTPERRRRLRRRIRVKRGAELTTPSPAGPGRARRGWRWPSGSIGSRPTIPGRSRAAEATEPGRKTVLAPAPRRGPPSRMSSAGPSAPGGRRSPSGARGLERERHPPIARGRRRTGATSTPRERAISHHRAASARRPRLTAEGGHTHPHPTSSRTCPHSSRGTRRGRNRGAMRRAGATTASRSASFG